MRVLLVPAFVSVAFVLLQILDITTYPLVTTDEAFLNDPALQLVHEGRFRNDVLSLNDGFDGPYFWQPPGLALLQAAIYKVAGFGLWQTRIGAIVFGGLACGLLYRLVEELTGRRAIALAAALLPFAWPTYLLTAKIARMDTHAIFFLLLATLLAVRSIDRADIRLPAAAGLCLGLAGMFHPAAVTWASGLVAAYAWQKRREPTLVLFMVLAMALPAAPWAIYAALHADAFAGQFLVQLANRSSYGSHGAPLTGGLLRYREELARVPLMLPLLLLAVVAGWRHILASRPLAMLLVATVVCFSVTYVISGAKHGFYQLYPITLLVVVAAAALPPITSKWGIAAAATLAGALVTNLILASYAPRAVALAAQTGPRDYALQFDELTRRLRRGDQVWGTAVAWYAIVASGGRLDAHREDVPVRWTTAPDPARHRFVVVLDDETFASEGYRRIGIFGQSPRRVLGRTYASQDYVYEIWQSTRLP